MARLQDFQSVTPQGTDNLLIVQAAGQGLATIANIASKIFGLKTAADLKLNSSSGSPTTAAAIDGKANKATTLSGYGITDAYTKTEVDNNKANKATTLAGYGITNAYTKTEVDNNNVRRYTQLWGTSCQTTIGRVQFLVLTNRVLYVVWLASANDINVANVAANTYQSGTGSVTLDNVTFTRLSNSNLKVQLSGSGTISIFG